LHFIGINLFPLNFLPPSLIYPSLNPPLRGAGSPPEGGTFNF